MKKWLKRLLAVLPALIFCYCSYGLGGVEKTHYGFPNPGIDVDAVLVLMMFAVLTFIASSIALFVRHRDRADFVLPYILNALALYRICQIVIAYQKYEYLRMDGLVR